ncbi:unnamed protein product [Leuciscus chuanchicus]
MESIRPIMKNRAVPIVLFELESSKDHCCGVSSQMTDLGWSLNSFAKAVVVLSSSIHTVLSVWLVQLISGIKSDRMAFCFSGRSYLVRERDVV